MNILKSNMFEQLVLFTQAIIDGLAVTALVSACYWYTITPVAPTPLMELCKDPVSFKTFALLTLFATLIAIPVATIRYQRLRKDTIKSCRTLFKENLLYRKKYKKDFLAVHAHAPIQVNSLSMDILVTTVMSALTISGVSLSTAWTYASLIIGCNFFAIISFDRWEACALTCIVCGSMLGCAVGFVKYKNLCRKELIKQMKKANRLIPLGIKISSLRSVDHFTLNKILYR